MFEPVTDGVSNVGCRMTQRAWVVLWADRLCQALHTWEIVDRLTAKVRVYSLIRNVQAGSLDLSNSYSVNFGDSC